MGTNWKDEMKFVMPKVVVTVEMSEYTAALSPNKLYVWVNPPRERLEAYDALVTELQKHEVAAAQQLLLPEQAEGKKEATPIEKAFEQVKRWLNIRNESKAEGLDEGLLKWYAEIWSQGPQETQWSVEELRDLEKEDPAFLSWMIAQTWNTRKAHIEMKKKV